MSWLEFAEGPLFRGAFLIMVLGLGRLVVVSIMEIIRMRRNTRDKSTSTSDQLMAAFKWLNPTRWLTEKRGHYTAISVIFHVGLIIVPIFFLPHIALWQRGIGFSWPGLATLWADALTLITIGAGLALVVLRFSDRGSRKMSQRQDWLLTPLCVLIFVTGYLAAHPASSPISYNTTRLIHVLSGDLIFVLMPFTNLAHVVLLPFTHLIADLSWKLVPGVGAKVKVALGTQDRPI